MIVAISLVLVQSMRWIGFEELRRDAGSVALKQDGLIIAQQGFAIVSIKHGPPTPSGILKTKRPIGFSQRFLVARCHQEDTA